MVDIPFPTSTNPGSAPGEGSGRLVNCFAYKDGTATRWRPVPGLAVFTDLPAGEDRGASYATGLLLSVAGSVVYQIDGGGGITMLEGTLPGDGPVSIARNNATPPTTTFVTSVGAYVVNNGVVKAYPDPPPPSADETYTNLPSVNSVTFLDGYFLWTTPDGRIFASDLASTNVNALSFTTASAKADGLLRGVTYGQQFFAFGQNSIEVYQDAGLSPFPLTRSSVIAIGLLAPFAVTGFEDGWAGPLIFVANDGSVRQLDGYTPTRISSEDLERRIASVPSTDLRAGVYTFGGNSIFSLSSQAWTWEYNLTTSAWHERSSYGSTRWRGGSTVKAFDDWMVADVGGGAIYRLDETVRTEAGQFLIWGMDAGPVRDFPVRIQVPGAGFDFALGEEPDPNQPAPQVMLSWSHDGGATWSNPILRSLGKQGRYRQRITVNRIGLTSAEGVRWRFRVSDPAYTSFGGGRMDDVERR